MTYLINLLNFKSTRERDDFIIAILVILFFAWLTWWLYPKFTSSAPTADMQPNIQEASGILLTQSKDSDGDGILDKDDLCKDVAGIAPDGCPSDADGDGITDSQDLCPTVAGKSKNGCPLDSDNDGIYDKEDACPQLAGTVATKGCPIDSDEDGVYDIHDKCPNRAGLESLDGCPEVIIEEEERKLLEEAIQGVEFKTGSHKLLRSSRSMLYRIVKIMKKYPDYKLEIIGHTDNTGDAAKNKTLSIQRAKTCFEYFVLNEIEVDRISYKGYGQKQPLESNDTEEGRSKNRRVEFNLSY